ncbi:galactokinase [Catenulispora subtropica]|uniref:Galactokinase n=1 Tax=Catenulispora subtropica TaxID=450798 RepID=A0ABP5DD10_9ACTN
MAVSRQTGSAVSADAVRRGFTEQFGGEPAGVWTAPGRVNVIGEHTDYNEGFVLPMAIDRACYAAAAPRADRILRVHAAQLGETVEVSLDALVGPGSAADTRGADDSDMSPLADPAVKGWAAYPVGVAWILQQAGYPVSGADVYLTSTVPVGAGLSSSAALECATGLALAGVSGFDLTKAELARHAQRAENIYAGVPCGPLDQMSSAFGEDGAVLFIDTRSGEVRPQPFDLAAEDALLLVIDTRVSHAHGENGYADRRAACERAAAFLGVRALRDIPLAELPETFAKVAVGLDETTARRVRHVVTENARVQQFVAILNHEDSSLPPLGHRMMQSHASLRDDYEVSAPELDLAVATAVAAGAHGARMTGGGFGGSAIALVDRDQLEAVQDAVRTAFAEHGYTEPQFFPAVASAGARRTA